MSDTDQIVAVKIFDRTYQIKCPSDEAIQLQESAKYLNEEMQKISQSGTVNSTERLAIVTALNISHELMMFKKQKIAYIDVMSDQIKVLQHRIQKFLGSKEEVVV